MFVRSDRSRIGTEIWSGPVRSAVSDRSRTDLGPDRSHQKIFDGAKIFQKLDRVAAIVFVQESSKSEPSSRFLSRLKFEKSTRHFWANSGDRPGICANLIRIRPNPGTIGSIRQKVASEISKFCSCIGGVMLIWWYDDLMTSLYHHMMIWWYNDMIWWYDDMMIWWYDDMMIRP